MTTNTSLGSLTEPGQTTNPNVRATGLYNINIKYEIKNINTNIVLRVEGAITERDSVTGEMADPVESDWSNLDSEGLDRVHTENGTYFIGYPSYSPPINFIRLKFISESGGTDAIVDNIILRSN